MELPRQIINVPTLLAQGSRCQFTRYEGVVVIVGDAFEGGVVFVLRLDAIKAFLHGWVSAFGDLPRASSRFWRAFASETAGY